MLRQPHRDFRLRIGSLCHRMHLESSSLASCGTSSWIALKIASTGPLPVDCVVTCCAVDVERERRRLRTHGAGDHGQRQHLDAVVGVRDLLVHQRLDVLVVDLLFLVGQRLEAHEGVFELIVGQV